MISIKSYEFLKRLYGYLNNQKNQGTFVIELFNAAGSRYFTMPASYAKRTNDYLEAERRYVKDRSLTAEIKASFPNPIDVGGLADFIAKNLKENKLLLCMTAFGIPAKTESDLGKFARSLAMQFGLFVTSPADDVDNSIWSVYQTLLQGKEIKNEDLHGPRYAGDDVIVDMSGRSHDAVCYEIIHHVWLIQNHGAHEWRGRRLVLVNGHEIRPRPRQTVIPLPDLKPGGHTKIATDIDARGFEGNFECKWEMQDADGENCFPNHRWDFNIRIHVTLDPSVGGKTRG